MKDNYTMTGAKATLFTCTINIFHISKDVTVYQKGLNINTNNLYVS